VNEGFHLLPIEEIGHTEGLTPSVVGQIRVGLSVFEKESENSAAWSEEEYPVENTVVNFETYTGM